MADPSLRKLIHARCVETCITDLDGTASPILILAKYAMLWATARKNDKMLTQLKELVDKISSQSYQTTLLEFTQIMHGTPVRTFDQFCKNAINDCYPSFEKAVKQLHELGLRIYLSSLTTEYIARIVSTRFRLDDWTCFAYPSQVSLCEPVYVALDPGDPLLLNLDLYKLRECKRKGWTNAKFLAIGDSQQDLPLFEHSAIAIGMNPTIDYSFDLAIKNEADPWRKLLQLLED